jgi:hypothetical protein
MTEKMYNDLMEHIDDLEMWGVIPTESATTVRKYIKQIEGVAIMVYNYYFSAEIPNAYYR